MKKPDSAIRNPQSPIPEVYHFCTYFDSNYLVRGLALYRSLARHAPPFVLYVLCLDNFTYNFLTSLNLSNLRLISLPEFEYRDENLLKAKETRTIVEYYFTCTPSLLLYVLNHFPQVDIATYLDADLFFYSNPGPIYEELGGESILIVEQRFPKKLDHLKRFGVYNVGVLSFRNDTYGKECLHWWRERCIEWCYDRIENVKFADQKYLDDWPRRFSGVVVLKHKGTNLAPWNIDGPSIQERNGSIVVDGDSLICYHFQGLKMITRFCFNPNLSLYGVELNATIRQKIYAPYLRELKSLSNWVTSDFRNSVRSNRASTLCDLIRLMIYDRTLLHVGPLTMELHLEPIVRPLLDLKRFITTKFWPDELKKYKDQ